MRRLKKRFVFVMLCAGIMLTACGKEERDRDKIKESLDSVGDSASVSDVDEDVIPERLEYEIVDNAGGKGHVIVDADVEASIYDSAKIYTQTPVEINDEFCNELADKLFDDGEYTIVKPYELMTLEELEEEKQFWSDTISELGYDIHDILYPYIAVEYNTVKYLIQGYNDSEVSESNYKKGEIIYEEIIESEEGTISEFTGNIRGKIDGKLWKMEIKMSDYGDGYINEPLITLYPVERNVIMEFTTCDSANDALYGGANVLSIEDGRKKATDVIDKLGFGEMEIVEEAQVYLNLNKYASQQEDCHLDGYNFVFMEKHKGTKPVYADNLVATLMPAEEKNIKVAYQFHVSVCVTSTGVRGISFRPMYITEEKTDNVELLSFEQVDSIAREYFADYVMESSEEVKITDVVLGHVTLKYEEGQYVLMPVWFFICDKSDEYMNETYGDRHAIIGINAIDGSLVQPRMINGHMMFSYW